VSCVEKHEGRRTTWAKTLLSWEPEVTYEEGFRRTIEWYSSHKNLEAVRRDLPKLLMER
jgi:dTDP-D-glucose 4,6-dehydratase